MSIFNKKISNHLAASLSEYLQYRPNNFLYFEMIKYAIKNKLEKVSFGPSLRKDRVAKFKLSMGAKPIPYENHIAIKPLKYKLLKNLYPLYAKIKKPT